MKLGKNEKKILKILFKEKDFGSKIMGYSYNPTHDIKIIQNFRTIKEIARFIYGEDGEDFLGNLKSTVKVSLSRTMKNMYKKKLVQKGKLTYQRFWNKENKYMSSKLKYLHIHEYEKKGYDIIENFSPYSYTPYNIRFIWILTEKGKEIVSNLI